jgi:putative integral membrane protein (TIGR02587 family)
MEMWWLGFSMHPGRLALLTVLIIPLLTAVSYIAGFEDTFTLTSDVLDALAAYAVGVGVAAASLATLGILEPGLPLRDIVGKVAIQAVPASIGALLARDQLGGPAQEDKLRRWDRFGGELLVMTVGAMFLSITLAATDEMVLIAYRTTAWHAVGLALLTLLLMVSLEYASGAGNHSSGRLAKAAKVSRYTLAGYAIALTISCYMLWSFGRLDGLGGAVACKAVVVLALPAGLGAGASRLIV